MTELDPTRRSVLRAGAMTTVAAGALAACGGSDKSTSYSSSTSSSSSDTSSSGGSLAKVADIPVGGAVSAKSADGKPVILSQPTAGTVVGFSAICTHKGCTVAPAGKQLDCPCHGSVYDAATGKNISGPAPSPLAAFPVHVDGGAVLPGA